MALNFIWSGVPDCQQELCRSRRVSQKDQDWSWQIILYFINAPQHLFSCTPQQCQQAAGLGLLLLLYSHRCERLRSDREQFLLNCSDRTAIRNLVEWKDKFKGRRSTRHTTSSVNVGLTRVAALKESALTKPVQRVLVLESPIILTISTMALMISIGATGDLAMQRFEVLLAGLDSATLRACF